MYTGGDGEAMGRAIVGRLAWRLAMAYARDEHQLGQQQRRADEARDGAHVEPFGRSDGLRSVVVEAIPRTSAAR